MSIETYLFSSPLLSYSCPSQTPPSAEWKSLDLAPEISAHAGETSSGNTKIQVKGTQGVECEVVFEGWKGSEGWINGWTNPNASTWCCSLDESKDWTCFRDDGKEDFDSTTLCVYSGLDPEQEHSIKVKNSPEGKSRLLIDSAFSNGRKGDEIKTTDINTRVSTAEPGTVDLKTYYSTSSSLPSSSLTSSSSLPSTSSNPPSSSSLPESSTSSSAPSATSTPGASSSSTGLFLVVALGILTIVVVCIIAILFLRTKPRAGRESSGLLRSKSERKRVKRRVERVLDQGSSDTEDEGDVEKGSTKKSKKKTKKGKYRDDDDRAETSTGGSEDEKMTSRRWSKRREEDVDTLIGEETTDDEEVGTSDEEPREKKSRRRDSHHDRYRH